MDAAYFVIAILGCADGGSACTPVATMPTQYQTAAQCSAATDAALQRSTDFDFPTLMAECRATAPKAAAAHSEQPIPAAARRS
jgi:hypothetical protein